MVNKGHINTPTILGKFALTNLLVLFSLLSGCVQQKNTIADFEGAYTQSLNYNFVSVTPATKFVNQLNDNSCYYNQNRKEIRDYQYLLGIGDKLFVKLAVINSSETYRENNGSDLTFILPQPHLSQDESSFAIDGHGNITVPYAGSIKAANKTIHELQQNLIARFKRYVHNPFVDVKVHKYHSKIIEVRGQITHPQRLEIDDHPMTVTRALQLAGGVTPEADLRASFVEDSFGKRKYIDLFELLHRGDNRYNVLLKHGDSLVVPYTDGNEVYVTGEVIDRKTIKTQSRPISLTQAVMDSNGPHPFAGDPSRVFVFRNLDTQKRVCSTKPDIETRRAGELSGSRIDVFHFDMRQPEMYLIANNFALHDNDIVYVATRPITDWQRFITQVLPANISFWADRRMYQ